VQGIPSSRKTAATFRLAHLELASIRVRFSAPAEPYSAGSIMGMVRKLAATTSVNRVMSCFAGEHPCGASLTREGYIVK
jgi:hypothetical protein